jgi:hypothetical protein
LISSREHIQRQLQTASLGASEKLDALRQQLAHETDPERRRALSLKIQAAAIERDRCLQALFATPRTL